MNTKDIGIGCTGHDSAGSYVVETVVTNDATNGLQAVIRYVGGTKDGLPGWLSLRWDVEAAHISAATVPA